MDPDTEIENLTDSVANLSIRNRNPRTDPPLMNADIAKLIGDAVAAGVKEGLAAREDNRNPKEFKGDLKDADKLFVFICEVETYGTRVGNSLEGNGLTLYASRYLGGSALLWFNMSQLELKDQPWSKFKQTLKEQFLSATFEDDMATKLMHNKQRTSVRAYAEEFMRISRYVRPEWANQELLKMLFCKGLKPQVQVGTLEASKDPNVTLGELMTRAQRVDAIVYRAGAARTPASRNPGYSSGFVPGTVSSGPAIDADGDTVMSLAVMAPKKMTPKERRFLVANGGCFCCRKLGHRSYSCPYKNKFGKKDPAINHDSLN
ncbi:hypothetical protein Cantr_04375 [Candida viswanathii]|uniref:Ty3 transposon capsid-like protein domain-containing protein n=1 Tax=Candida viswanathii TaxID=5486 RepID=A0A367XL93_9ASCO|nr:hypothetical protein Cantr_04375 [Candida viswanathii]